MIDPDQIDCLEYELPVFRSNDCLKGTANVAALSSFPCIWGTARPLDSCHSSACINSIVV